ncbi:MAG: sigma factor-like helix-turn-helix DNA-binding protein, partial [Clostridia bacterium]|nr:sigma factor-like helix-turn-helix DNA-binding protein [Clostridia bacterium]
DNCDLSDPKADPLSYLVKKDLLEKLHEYINEKLTDSEQNVLKLYMKGYSYVEISAMTGKTKKAVDTALQRARKKLAFFKEN